MYGNGIAAGECPSKHEIGHLRRSRAFKRPRQLIQCCAGGHDIIDNEYSLFPEIAIATKRITDIACPRRKRKGGLQQGRAMLADLSGHQPTTSGCDNVARELVRLIESPLGHPLCVHGHGDEQWRIVTDVRCEQRREPGRKFQAMAVFERLHDPIYGILIRP